MFGNVSAFVNGNMFLGAFGTSVFVRLSGDARDELLSEEGASVFEPMKGRQMKDYIMIPSAWTRQPAKIRPWVSRSLDLISKLPPKGK